MTAIKNIKASEILDSRGIPTVKVIVELTNGIARASCVPSGASTGRFEALEMRDGDDKRYGGKGVLNACRNVNTKIAKALEGQDVLDQEKIDKIMIDLDGTKNKSNLGANAILGVSLAVARVAAKASAKPLYKYIAETFGFAEKNKLPVPMFNVINGGKHADSGLDIQEFMIVPNKIAKFSEMMRAGSEIYHQLKTELANEGFTVAVGDEGGFAPKLNTNRQALEFISEGIEKANYKSKVSLAIDAAASVFYNKNTEEYILKAEGANLSSERLVSMYGEWVNNFNLLSIEDGLEEEEWDNWSRMTKKINSRNKNVLLIGDDFLVTNIERLRKAIKQKSANAILIKLNQIGTLTETVNCIKEAQKAKWKVVVSHRSGETTDNFIADLAMGAQADYIKAGAPCRGERLVKYNRLLAIEEELKR